MKKYNSADQLDILSKSYISCEDICNLVPIGTKQAYKLIKEIEQDMRNKNIPCFFTRPKLVPTKFVVEKLQIDIKYIKQLSKLQKGKKDEN